MTNETDRLEIRGTIAFALCRGWLRDHEMTENDLMQTQIEGIFSEADDVLQALAARGWRFTKDQESGTD